MTQVFWRRWKTVAVVALVVLPAAAVVRQLIPCNGFVYYEAITPGISEAELLRQMPPPGNYRRYQETSFLQMCCDTSGSVAPPLYREWHWLFDDGEIVAYFFEDGRYHGKYFYPFTTRESSSEHIRRTFSIDRWF